jgi:glycosyltransferase involved in cell wall biosynthesis
MKVCLLCYRGNPRSGGQGVYLYHLARELCELGHEVDVIVGRPWPRPLGKWARVRKIHQRHLWGLYGGAWARAPRPLELLAPGHLFDLLATRLRFFPEPFTFSLRALRHVSAMAVRRGLDVIHDVQTLGYGIWAMKAFGAPVVTTVHHPLTVDLRAALARDPGLHARYHAAAFYPVRMQGRVIRRLDRVITASEAGRDTIRRDFRVRPERIAVVANGIDLETFHPDGGAGREPATLLFVGNTDDRRKGAEVLLQALAGLPDSVRLRIVDDPYPARSLAPKAVARLGLEGRVEFTGRLAPAALAAEYRRCTLLVQPSWFEGFGLPAAEAMACGAPVIATRAGAVEEIVPPEAGALVPAGDSAALAETIQCLLDDPPLRERMGAAGARHAEAHFSWRLCAERVVAVYRSVAAAGAPEALPPGAER